MKLLITGAEGDIADALCRIARVAWPAARVHGSDLSGDTWPQTNGFAVLHQLPNATSSGYVPALRALQQRERYDLIVPVTDAELWTIANESVDDLPLLTVGGAWLRFSLDKAKTAQWLIAVGLPAPFTTALSEATAADLPVIVKPRRGHGSRGLEIVHSAERLADVQRERTDEAIAQEYVGDAGSEFTCCIFRDRQSSIVRTVTLRRVLQGGLTGRATVEYVEAIDALLRAMAEKGDLDGSANVQLRLTAAGPRVFEINPRFSSTVMMRHLIGFRDFVWAVESRLQGSAPGTWVPPVGTRILRLSRELVVSPSAGDAG